MFPNLSFPYLAAARTTTTNNMADLQAIAKAIVAPYKGILAADESTATIKARFDKVSILTALILTAKSR